MKNLLYRLLMLLPHVDIVKDVDGEKVLYLRRFFLFRSKWLKKIGINANFGNLYLHQILRSDEDPDPHDHPWDFTSLILSGGYLDEQWLFEMMPDHDFERVRFYSLKANVKPGRIYRRRAEHIHRVRLYNADDGRLALPGDPCRPAWTLVKTGPYRRNWHFYKQNHQVLWWEYLGLPKPENLSDDIG